MMPSLLSGPRIDPGMLLREDKLPTPLSRRIWVFARKRVGHDHPAETVSQVALHAAGNLVRLTEDK